MGVVTIEAAVEALRGGAVVGLPTDTVYGIGVDPFQEVAMGSLFFVKGRGVDKAIPVLAADLQAVRLVALVAPELEGRLADHWPGALTAVLPKAADAPAWVGDVATGTVAVRVPDHPLALELLSRFGPLAVTSANESGAPPTLDDVEALAALGNRVAVYLPGVSPGGMSSTVVDLTGAKARVLRPGPVVWEDE